MANRLTLGIYASGQYKYNVVKEEDVENHIKYNQTFRPGRLLYVDGERVCDGCVQTNENLDRYDKIAEAFYKNAKVNMNIPTLPYT